MFLVLFGAVVTLATGLLFASATYTPGGVRWNDYGFPLPWKVDLSVSCAPWCSESGGTSYNWFFFAIDVVFYGAIGYGILAAYKRFVRRVKTGRLGSHTLRKPCEILYS